MATRFRLPASGSAAVSPAIQSYTHTQTTRRPLPTTDSTALATQAYTPDAADHLVAGDAHHCQFVSDPLAVQNLSAQTVKYAIQALEAHTNNNLFIQIWIGLYSNNGSTLIATLLAKSADGTEIATSLTNRTNSATTTGYNMAAGDDGARIVVELSVTGTPTSGGGVQGHNASLRFGSNGGGGDLAENDTETGTTFNPWLEFANTITFQTPPRFGRISWAEMEVPNAPRKGRVSWAEFEVPNAPRQGRVSWAEMETPDKRIGRFSFAEFEVPPIPPRMGRLSWAEFEVPVFNRFGRVSWAEFETPNAVSGGGPIIHIGRGTRWIVCKAEQFRI